MFVEFSDGELQEGATFEALMAGASFRLDNLVALIDCNGIQADGRIVIDIEPVADKCRAFGWDTVEIDGNVDGGDRHRAARRAPARRQAEGDRAAHPARPRHRDAGAAARKRISSASSRTNGPYSSASWRRAMSDRAGGRTLGMGEKEKTGTRPAVDAPFGHALAALARERPDIVGLSADLAKYTDMLPFRDAFPDRFFNVGMAEQNLIAVSAGLAKTGHTAFCTTYGVFATRRAYDFIAIACAHSNVNVKIFAGLPGLTTGYGGTHQAIEDLALMRMIPGLVVIDPCDATEIAQVTRSRRGASGADLLPAAARSRTARARPLASFPHRRRLCAARRRQARHDLDRHDDRARARRRR